MKKIISVLLCLMVFLSVEAQNVIRPKIAGPNGLWVNSYNGVLFFGQTDFETQNTVMPMQLRFYYNSSANNVNYGYGLGFSLGYEMRYELDGDGNVIIETGDGRTDTYTKYGDDFESPAGVFSTLTYSDGKFILTEKTGDKYEFADAQLKRLTAQEDRHGNRITLTYSLDSLLTQIKDGVGHTINLEYTNKLLTRATASFHSGSITYSYDSKKRLIKRTDAMGFSTVYDYDRENHIDEITNANGHKTNIFYNASGMVSRMKTAVSDKSIRYDGDKTVFIDYTQPQNRYTYYRWDDKGRVIEKVGLCCGIQSKIEYDEDDNVIKRTDANGNSTTYTYDDRGNMLSMTDAKGNTELYTYDDMYNNVTSYQDKNGNFYRFDYNGKGDLISVSGAEGFSISFTYNDNGWPLTVTDSNNNVTRTTYNADGSTAQIMDAAGYINRFGYDSYGKIISSTDAKNQQGTIAYDANNRIVSLTDALGNTTTLSYDKVGNIVRVKNAKNQITAYTYDALGHVLTQTDAMGGVYRYTYDGSGNVLTVTNPLGQVQSMTYNERNKLLSQTNAANETTSFDYDANGNLSAIFQPNGNVIGYVYDSNNQLEEVSDNLGVIARYTYDNNGNSLTVSDGMNRTMTYVYDGLNRLVMETLPSGNSSSYTYDSNSNLLTVTDAKGKVTTYTYNSLNQPVTITDALNAVTKFEYDGNGNLIRAIDANGNATTYTYNAVDQNTAITFANGLSLQYSYDNLGRVIESKDRAGNTFLYSYDALGRILSKTYPDNTQDVYTYDAVGQMLSAINKDATVKFTYDGAGRVLSETLNGKTTGYSYDVAAGIRTITYPSGMKVVELLNVRDLITSILQNGEEVVSMQYNLTGQKTTQTFANGITTSYNYNKNGWLSQISDNKQVMSLKMRYDANGNIIQREDVLHSDRTENYGYDAIGQLTSFRRGTTIENKYQYDLLGNRVKVQENGVATNYVSNNVNAYTSITGGLNFTPQYDDNGNMLNDDKHTYAYDWNNRQIGVDDGAVSVKYDALGRRIAKDNTLYFYVGDQMVEEWNINSVQQSFIYGNNINELLKVSRNKDNDDYYYQSNHLGSIISITDKNGKMIEDIEYDAFGNFSLFNYERQKEKESLIGNHFYFDGHYYDFETSLYYNRMRQYKSNIGRFCQKDIIFYSDGMNDYKYVLNSPIVFLDISGFKPNYYEARELAKAGYEDNTNKIINVNGNEWNRIHTWDDKNTGFHAALFEKNGEYVLSTSGTNPTSLSDWLNNFTQAFGFVAPQYAQSLNLAKKLSDYLGDCELTFVGHSLGGGLASGNSRYTGRDAITFNAAALNESYNYHKKSNIDAYITNGDILHWAQKLIGQTAEGNHISNPNNPGKPFILPPPFTIPGSGIIVLYDIWAGINNHTSY